MASFLRLWREPETSVAPENPNVETFMNVEFLYFIEELNQQCNCGAPSAYSQWNRVQNTGSEQ